MPWHRLHEPGELEQNRGLAFCRRIVGVLYPVHAPVAESLASQTRAMRVPTTAVTIWQAHHTHGQSDIPCNSLARVTTVSVCNCASAGAALELQQRTEPRLLHGPLPQPDSQAHSHLLRWQKWVFTCRQLRSWRPPILRIFCFAHTNSNAPLCEPLPPCSPCSSFHASHLHCPSAASMTWNNTLCPYMAPSQYSCLSKPILVGSRWGRATACMRMDMQSIEEGQT